MKKSSEITNNQKAILNPETWVNAYADVLYNFAFLRVHRSEIAEDLVQDTFLQAIRSIGSFKGQSSEKTWLISILKNKIIDYYRKKSTQNELAFSGFASDDDNSHFFDNDGHWKDNTAPSYWDIQLGDDLEKREFTGFLQRCLSKLPEMWRAVFALKNVDELNSEEICKELQISSSNYWVIMHRSKLQLRDCLEKTWYKR